MNEFLKLLQSSLASLFKILILSKYRISYKSIQRNSDECVILGNGPSLNDFLNNHIDFIDNKDTFSVNLFVRTDAFTKIKPTHYVIAAPQYWRGEKQEEYIQSRIKTLQSIEDTTNWPMNFFAPSFARRDKEWLKRFSRNEQINIQYFNTTPVEGFQGLNHSLFRKNLGMPRPHNVLIATIYLAIQTGYKKIYITGADHSWLKDIFVTPDNVVLASQKHFYDQEMINDPINNASAKPLAHNGEYISKKMHEVLHKFQVTFESHYRLSIYAKSMGVEIINLCPKSFIDSYSKREL